MSLPLIIQLCYAVFCVGLAGVNYWIIEKKQWKVKHFWNGLIHIAFWIAAWFFIGWYVLALPFIARVAFDWSLSLFRGKPLGYVSIKPASVADKVEKSIFGMNGVLPKLVWVAVAIVLNILL
jgi:hypothetical protein